MFALALIKFNRLSIRTRLLAGLSVGLIFLLLISIIGYKIFCFDELSRYASIDTEVYLHLDNRDSADNFYRLKLTDSLLDKFKLTGLDRHWLGSEMAVICDNYSKNLVCGLVIQTNKPNNLRNYLTANHYEFIELSDNIYILGADAAWLKSIKASYNPFRYLSYQGEIGRYGALTIVINRPFNLGDDLQQIFKLGNIKTSAKFSGTINNSEILIKPEGLKNILPVGLKNIKTLTPDNSNCDLQINSKISAISSAFSIYLLNFATITASTITPKMPNDYFNLCLNKTGSSGNLIADYDILWQSSKQLDSPKIQTLENELLNLATKNNPIEKTSYLDDGTRISELFPSDPASFSFQSASGTKFIKLNDTKNLYYSNSGAGLMISNNPGLILQNYKQNTDQSIFLKLNSLPSGQIKDIFSDFSFLTVIDNQIILR